jgi:transposase InsO family protein
MTPILAHKPGEIGEIGEIVGIDFYGPIPMASDCSYILTVVDKFSKLVTIPAQGSNGRSCKHISLLLYCTTYGVPVSIISDRGAQFMSKMFTLLAALLGIKHLKTTAYHPSGNGQTERVHRPLTVFLRALKHEGKLSQWPVAVRFWAFRFKKKSKCSWYLGT